MSRSSLAVFACVALGGAVGAVARHGVTSMAAARSGGGWPATLAVNLLGCLLLGVAWRFVDQPGFPPAVRGLLVGGLLGAFTTFAAFGLDALTLLEQRRPGLAAAYLLASVAGGLLLVWAGRAAAAMVAGID